MEERASKSILFDFLFAFVLPLIRIRSFYSGLDADRNRFFINRTTTQIRRLYLWNSILSDVNDSRFVISFNKSCRRCRVYRSLLRRFEFRSRRESDLFDAIPTTIYRGVCKIYTRAPAAHLHILQFRIRSGSWRIRERER